MDISLKAMRYFAAAANSGNITEASKQLHVVPSAVLAAVNQVEAAFGLKLTIRHRSKGITLTHTGKIILARIQHLLDEYEMLVIQGAEMHSQLVGTLRVGYYAPVAPAFFPQIAYKLLSENPRVQIKFIECDSHAAQAGLLSGDFDVIICVAESLASGVTYETLIEMPAYLLVPQHHAFAARTSVSLVELHTEPMVLLDLPVIGEYYSRLFERENVTPPIVCTATTLEMVRSLVGTGVGCSLLHMRPKTRLTYSGHRIAEVPIGPPVDSLKIVLGYMPENPRRIVSYFINSLRTLFADTDVSDLLVKNDLER